jgi:hypothetical protein
LYGKNPFYFLNIDNKEAQKNAIGIEEKCNEIKKEIVV